MLVYGDRTRAEDPRAMLARILAAWARAAGVAAGIERHAALVAAFIEAGELLQGVADAQFEARGCDADSPEQAALTALLMRAARGVIRSWETGFAAPVEPLAQALPDGSLLAERIEVKRGEGYAFYALYPESYAQAARELARAPDATVIGIRSIGTGLAAVVAATLGAKPPTTVRPTGHPFRRELSLSDELARQLTAGAGPICIVDEGPGLSGSSFGTVADFLEARGVPRARLHAFPSHDGDPGPQASGAHRSRWQQLPRHCVAFDALSLRAVDRAHRLEAWLADLIGPLHGPLEEISAGAWRRHRFSDEAAWPPVWAQQERRKFLARTAAGTWLAKFAGVGEAAATKLSRARRLHEAGFTPEPAGVCHGFLVERWIDNAEPVDPGRAGREGLLETVARYIAFRARSFPAAAGSGASLAELLAMARHNAAEALGPAVAEALAPLAHEIPRLEQHSRPIEVDGRMHAWEWLDLGGGRYLKTDALDHHAGHDLIGCQDVAWDVVGASVELGLSQAEQERLATIVAREARVAVAPELLRFLTPCYLAFQLGRRVLGAQAAAVIPAEAARLTRAAAGYADELRRAVSPHL